MPSSVVYNLFRSKRSEYKYEKTLKRNVKVIKLATYTFTS